jgi:hypothetical protein
MPSSTPEAVEPPPYAFNGAYANYTLTYYTQTGPYVYRSNFTISKVDAKTQTFSVRSIYTSYMAPFGSVDNATFVDPIPFPAASPSQLEFFKEGKAPLGYYDDNFTSNVVVTVPAGTFLTYEVQAPVSTVWFDSVTGILVKENGLMLGAGPAGFVALTLATTNIKPKLDAADQTVLLQVLLAAVVATAVVFLSVRLADSLGRTRRNSRDHVPAPRSIFALADNFGLMQ